MDKVFVYGTLMKGYGNYCYYLSESEFLGKGEITGYALYAVSSFPGIVPEVGEKVKGEVYKVNRDTLKRLDSLEGEGSLYLRKQVEVLVEGQIVQGWTYIWNHETEGTEKIEHDAQPWKGKVRG
ncbi:MAG: gamma-glutamylcyclotransferase family protein [Desulfitobacteriaceae bacterium]